MRHVPVLCDTKKDVIMKQKIDRQSLLSTLDVLSPGLSPKDIVEQSSCVAVKDGVAMTYNGEIACRMDTDLRLEGAIVAAPWIEALRKIKDDQIALEPREGEIVIHGKGLQFGITLQEDILLPIEEVEQPGEWHKVPDEFGDAVDMVVDCAGRNENEFNLTCVNLTKRFIECSDNFQLGRYKMKLPLDESILIRSASIKHIVSLGMNEMSLTDSWLHFRNPKGMILSCLRYNEEYPDFTPFLKQEGSEAKLPKALGEASELAEVFSSQNTDNNEVTVRLVPGKVLIEGRGSSGWSKQAKKLTYNGPPLVFNISPKLLRTITSTYSHCQLNERVLKVEGGAYSYCTALGTHEA